MLSKYLLYDSCADGSSNLVNFDKFSTNLHYRALCAIFIWESISSGVVKMLLHSSHMDLELKMVSKSVL